MKNIMELKAYLDKEVSSGKTPGLQYLVFQNNEILYQQNTGMADFEANKDITRSSFFNACSVTKTFTSLAIMQLAEAEKIRLSDFASFYLNGLPFRQEIKISQLLSHTSGLANPIPLRWAHLQEEEATFDSEGFIRDVLNKHAKLKYAPGEKFAYSNLNYLLLGQIIEKVSGMSYRDYIRKHIISLLDLNGNHLDFIVAEDTYYARGYQKRFSPINLILGFIIDKNKFMTKSSHPGWMKFNKYYVSGRAYGGMIANAWSLTCFISTLMKPESVLLSDEWKKTLFTKQKTIDGKEVAMTMGWFTGKLNGVNYFAHAGAGGGYYCEMRMYPDTQIVSAIMFNRTGMRDERFLDKPDSYSM